jgi:hypothetical protein
MQKAVKKNSTSDGIWCVPRCWEGATAIIVASGPSLSFNDYEQVKYLESRRFNRQWKLIVINDNYKLFPWADVLYACDLKWWNWNPEAAKFKGMKVTIDAQAAPKYGLLQLKTGNIQGLAKEPDTLNTGSNSGFQAINLAVHLGVKKIVLVGYDMQLGQDGKRHWFGDHPDKIQSTYEPWVINFCNTRKELDALGIKVINCSHRTALKCFDQKRLNDCC